MDDSILAKFPDDDHVLGPFLGNLPPEILDAVVQKLGWFQTTFAMAGRTCREAVERVPNTRAVVTEEERGRLQSWTVFTEEQCRRLQSREITSLAVAAMEGDVEALEWLIQLFDGKRLWWRDVGAGVSCLAVGRGKIESLKCLRANGCPWNEDTCAFAAYGGHLEVLQWAHQHGCEWDKFMCMRAAAGHLEVLQWARQNGCPWNEWTCEGAAGAGHLEMLQWARQNGCPWHEETCRSAAWGGHLEVLQWARENGCPWDEETCALAADEGHLEMLQWARQNGCPWNSDTCAYAACGGHLEVLQWAHQNGCPWDEDTWWQARSHSDINRYLIEHGCPGAHARGRAPRR